MKKGIIIMFLIIASVLYFAPVNTMALESNIDSNVVSNTFNIADITGNTEDETWLGTQKEENNNKAILGDPEDEDSVAWLIYLVLNIIKIAGPILVILLSSIDYIMVIIKSDNDAFAKAQKKLITRLILAILLFLIPVIVQVILEVFGITGSIIPGVE